MVKLKAVAESGHGGAFAKIIWRQKRIIRDIWVFMDCGREESCCCDHKYHHIYGRVYHHHHQYQLTTSSTFAVLVLSQASHVQRYGDPM